MNSSLQSSKELSSQTFEYEEHSKINYPNHLPRSQSSLKLSLKSSRNLNKPQISEALWIQSFKAPEELPPQTFEDEEHMKNTKNKEFLTSS